MVEKQTNKGLWIGLLSLQLILLFVSHLTYGYIFRVYYGVEIPTPSCPEGVNNIHMDTDLASKCHQERRSMILPSWVAAARLAILGEFLTILSSSILFWKKIRNRASETTSLFVWVAVSIIVMLPIICHSIAYPWGEHFLQKLLITGEI